MTALVQALTRKWWLCLDIELVVRSNVTRQVFRKVFHECDRQLLVTRFSYFLVEEAAKRARHAAGFR